MQAIVLENGQYSLRECKEPTLAPENLQIKVAYAGVNRADLFQKLGKYPLPVSKPPIPGMEVSGEVIKCGEDTREFRIGDKVCALLGEGAFAERISVPASLVLPLPKSVTLEEGAALPEACFTAWVNLVWQAKLKAGETVLIHGGASGIGIVAIGIARLLGARVFATAGTDEKCAACVKVGAEAINYKTEDYVERVRALTGGKGVDVIMDMVGGDYFGRNLECLAQGGRLTIIALLKGAKVEASISPILLKHLTVTGSTLRARTTAEKAQMAKEIKKTLWPRLEKGELKPVIDQIFSLKDTEKALVRMQEGLNVGKILIKV